MAYTNTTGQKMIQGLHEELERANDTINKGVLDCLDIDETSEYLHAALEMSDDNTTTLLEVHYSLTDDCGLFTTVEHHLDPDTGILEPMFPEIMSLQEFSAWVDAHQNQLPKMP